MKKKEEQIFDAIKMEEFLKNKDRFPYGELLVECETKIDLDESVVKSISEAVIYKKTKRGSLVYVKDFSYLDGILSFNISGAVDRSFHLVHGTVAPKSMIATTFVDFCWLLGDGTTAKTVIEVDTPIRENAVLGDLSQVLPSKFSDELVEAMHSLNLQFFEGILGETVMYGPHFFYDVPNS